MATFMIGLVKLTEVLASKMDKKWLNESQDDKSSPARVIIYNILLVFVLFMDYPITPSYPKVYNKKF